MVKDSQGRGFSFLPLLHPEPRLRPACILTISLGGAFFFLFIHSGLTFFEHAFIRVVGKWHASNPTFPLLGPGFHLLTLTCENLGSQPLRTGTHPQVNTGSSFIYVFLIFPLPSQQLLILSHKPYHVVKGCFNIVYPLFLCVSSDRSFSSDYITRLFQ